MNPSIARFLLPLLALLVVLGAWGCDRGTPPAVAKVPEGAKLAKVVFVGQVEVCDCTARTIEETYAALEAALGNPPKLPIERLELDADPEKVEVYQKEKAIMSLPAVFFVDDSGKILASLQGPQTQEQFSATLGNALPSKEAGN